MSICSLFSLPFYIYYYTIYVLETQQICAKSTKNVQKSEKIILTSSFTCAILCLENKTFTTNTTKGGDIMAYDYSKLIGRMAELNISRDDLAAAIGVSRSALYHKMRSDTEFTQDEIKACVKTLNLDQIDIPQYFFMVKV